MHGAQRVCRSCRRPMLPRSVTSVLIIFHGELSVKDVASLNASRWAGEVVDAVGIERPVD
jgi:hypothetical protein